MADLRCFFLWKAFHYSGWGHPTVLTLVSDAADFGRDGCKKKEQSRRTIQSQNCHFLDRIAPPDDTRPEIASSQPLPLSWHYLSASHHSESIEPPGKQTPRTHLREVRGDVAASPHVRFTSIPGTPVLERAPHQAYPADHRKHGLRRVSRGYVARP